MATMATEVYRAFRKAGVSEYIATAAASVIPYKDDIADLVTKQDLSDVQIEVAELRAELKRDAAKLRAEKKQDRAELKQDIAEISGEVAELKGEVAKFHAEVKQDRAELNSGLRVLKVVYAPILISLLVALIGLHFFVWWI